MELLSPLLPCTCTLVTFCSTVSLASLFLVFFLAAPAKAKPVVEAPAAPKAEPPPSAAPPPPAAAIPTQMPPVPSPAQPPVSKPGKLPPASCLRTGEERVSCVRLPQDWPSAGPCLCRDSSRPVGEPGAAPAPSAESCARADLPLGGGWCSHTAASQGTAGRGPGNRRSQEEGDLTLFSTPEGVPGIERWASDIPGTFSSTRVRPGPSCSLFLMQLCLLTCSVCSEALCCPCHG